MRAPARFALFAVPLAALALAAGCTNQKLPPRTPLRLDDFRKQWNADKNAFVDPAGQPLYDRAEAKYGHRELDLRAAARAEDGSEFWYRVDVPSRSEMTDEYFTRLETIPEFEFNRWTLVWNIVSAAAALIAGLYFVGRMESFGRRRRRTTSVFAFLIAWIAFWELWSLQHALPSQLGLNQGLPAWRMKLFESGPIPWSIVITFVFGMTYLFQIWVVHVVPFQEAQAHEQSVVEAARTGNLYRVAHAIQEAQEQGHSGFYTTAFRRLLRMYQRGGDIGAVQRLRDEILENHDRTFQLSFTAVRYAEWMLPLLGFLGTVIGLGQALGSLQEGIVFTREAELPAEPVPAPAGPAPAAAPAAGAAIDPAKVNDTFAGMALAFDTTFEGLFGLMLVGGIHAVLRKKIDQAMAEAQIIFTDAIEGWEGHTPRVHVTVNSSDAKLSGIQQSIEALRVGQETLVAALIKCIQEDADLYTRFGRSLFPDAVAASAEYQPLVVRLRAEIGAQPGHAEWELSSVSAIPGQAGWCAALVGTAGTGSSLLVLFEVAGGPAALTTPLTILPLAYLHNRLTMCGTDLALVRREVNARLYWCRAGALDPAPAWPHEIYVNDQVLAWPAGAIVVHGDVADRTLTFLPDGPGAGAVALYTGVQHQQCEWRLAAVAPDGGQLILAGHNSLHQKAYLAEFLAPAAGGAPAAAIPFAPPTYVTLTGVRSLTQVEWLSPTEVLLVQDDGKLFVFHLKHAEPDPLTHPAYRPGAGTRVRAGPGRRFAAFQTPMLSFWRVTATWGLVEEGRERFEAPDVRPPRVDSVVRADGSACLVGGDQQLITVWNFPHFPHLPSVPAPKPAA